jgi:adenylate cyclase
MAVRYKILALACTLILLFAVAIGISTLLAGSIKDRMTAILSYHLPLTGLLAKFDRETFRYELFINRALHDRPDSPEAIEATAQMIRDSLTEARVTLREADELLERGIGDPSNAVEDRLVLAKLKGIMAGVIRDLSPYGKIGERVIASFGKDDAAAGIQAANELEQFNDSFDVDTGKVTRTISQLSVGAVERTLTEQRRALGLDFALFIATAAIGVSFAAVLARRIAAAMRELVAGAQKVEGGDLTIVLPDRGRDEIALLARAFNRMVVELKSRERIKDTFGKFVDPRVVARLVDASADTPDAAERRVATVFFSDIKGFSSLSEALTASAMVKLLNSYFSRMTDAVRAHNGVVDKYIGDAVMAFWAAPFTPGDSHAGEAVLSALEQQQALIEFRQELPQILGLRRNVPEFKIRIGIATGEVVLGTIGSASVKSFTVIGDTVNLASRIEGINKVFGTSILVTEDTWKLASAVVDGREVDRIVVAGKSEPVSLYEVMAVEGALTPEQERLIEHYGNGLAAYRSGEWALAKSAFRAALDAMPDDGPSKLMLSRIARLDDTCPADWDGIWRFNEK